MFDFLLCAQIIKIEINEGYDAVVLANESKYLYDFLMTWLMWSKSINQTIKNLSKLNFILLHANGWLDFWWTWKSLESPLWLEWNLNQIVVNQSKNKWAFPHQWSKVLIMSSTVTVLFFCSCHVLRLYLDWMWCKYILGYNYSKRVYVARLRLKYWNFFQMDGHLPLKNNFIPR